MASPVISGDIIQVVYRTILFEQNILNVLHYRVSQPIGTPSYTEDLDFLTGLLEPGNPGTLGTAIRTALATNATILDITLQRIYPNRSFYLRTPLGLAGQSTLGEATAANVSAVVSKQSEAAGRGRTGSFHLGGVPAAGYTFGRLTAAFRADMVPVADALKADITDPGTEAVLMVPGMFGLAPGQPDPFRRVVQTFTQDTLRIVRRRTVGVGI